MIYLLLGPDDFTKKEFVDSLAREKGADLAVFGAEDSLPPVSKFLELDLFSGQRVFCLPYVPLGFYANLEKLAASPNLIAVMAVSLDKRKKEVKELLSHPKVIQKDFILPHASDLDKWIVKKASELGGKISAEAANELARRLGRDDAKETKFGGKTVNVEEIYNLWQVRGEIQKLLGFAEGREISINDVVELVSESSEVDAIQITNALAQKNKALSFSLIGRFLKEQTASDEKGNIIQLNAILAEQFRNIRLLHDFEEKKVSEDEILEHTGWKSGRLFVLKKIASRFKPQLVLDLLGKLSALDEELKTSQVPPRVLLDLILAQLF